MALLTNNIISILENKYLYKYQYEINDINNRSVKVIHANYLNDLNEKKDFLKQYNGWLLS